MSETVAQTITRLTAFIQEKAPTVDVSPGSVFNELMIGLESQIQNQVYNDINSISSQQAISTALNSVTDTYSPVVDAIASNYDTYRGQGAYASGNIKVYIAVPGTYRVVKGTQFIQPNLNYTYSTTADVTYSSVGGTIFTEGSLYYFTVNVTADVVGSKSTISNGTQFSLTNTNAIPQFVKAVALGTFSPGLDIETDKEVITRFRNGLGTKNLLSLNSITHQLASTYPNFQSAHIEDAASPVNLRSLNTVLGINVPSCVDVYIKNSITIPNITFQAVGTWVAVDNVNQIPAHWEFNVANTVAPGFYRVLHVTNAADTGLTYLKFQTIYGGTSTTNLIPNAASARYSVYQTATIRVFDLPYSSSAPTFNVTVMAPPNLQDIQASFLDEGNRIPCGDYVAKGVIPCLVSMNISLVRKNSTDVINTVALQGDIFNYINGLVVGQPIAVSQIVNLCHKYNVARVDLPIVLNGRILAPYQSSTSVVDYDVIVAGTDFLSISDNIAKGITSQNTMFFVSYFNADGTQNINISVK